MKCCIQRVVILTVNITSSVRLEVLYGKSLSGDVPREWRECEEQKQKSLTPQLLNGQTPIFYLRIKKSPVALASVRVPRGPWNRHVWSLLQFIRWKVLFVSHSISTLDCLLFSTTRMPSLKIISVTREELWKGSHISWNNSELCIRNFIVAHPPFHSKYFRNGADMNSSSRGEWCWNGWWGSRHRIFATHIYICRQYD